MKRATLLLLLMAIFNTGFCENKTAPDFKLRLFNAEESMGLSSLVDGKSIVILSFFDTSCKPCLKEIPKLNSIAARFPGSAKVFMVCLDEKAEEVLPEYINKNGVNVPILLDPLGYRAGEKYGVIKFGAAEIPQVFVIDKNGKIRHHYQGYHEDIEQQLAANIQALSKELYVKPVDDKLRIVYSGSSNGYLESCDCPQNPFGGIVRKVQVIGKIKDAYPKAIVVDSGDYLPPREDRLLAQYTMSMIQMIDYDMIAIGDQEILNGIDMIKKGLKTIPFRSANTTTCDEKMCYPLTPDRYIMKDAGVAKVALVSVINPDIFFLFPKDKMKEVKIINHIELLKSLIPEIKKEADIIVLVSHCGDEEDKKIAEAIAGIDIIVGGHSQTLHMVPLKVNDTLIVQAGQNSHRIGVLELKLDKNKKILSYENNFTLLNSDIPDDKAARQLTDAYKKELKEKTKMLVK